MTFSKEERETICALTYASIQCIRSFNYEITLESKPSLCSSSPTIPTIREIQQTITKEIVFESSMIEYPEKYSIDKINKNSTSKQIKNMRHKIKSQFQLDILLELVEKHLHCTFIYPEIKKKINGKESKKCPIEMMYSLENNYGKKIKKCQNSIDTFIDMFYNNSNIINEIQCLIKQGSGPVKERDLILEPIDFFTSSNLITN